MERFKGERVNKEEGRDNMEVERRHNMNIKVGIVVEAARESMSLNNNNNRGM